MDLSQWRYTEDASTVPPGKPFVIDGHICLKMPATGDQTPDLMAVLNGASPGIGHELRKGPCLYFEGEVAFEAASTEALISARRDHWQFSAGCLAGGRDGFFAVVEFKGYFGSIFYGVDAAGQLVKREQVEDIAFPVVREWKVVVIQKDGRRTDLVQVFAPKKD